MLVEKLPVFMQSSDLEVQERVRTYMYMYMWWSCLYRLYYTCTCDIHLVSKMDMYNVFCRIFS